MKLVVIDTDVLAIDEIYTNDSRYRENKMFLDSIAGMGGTTVYNVLELTGIVTMAIREDSKNFFWRFHDEKGLRILYPRMMGEYLDFKGFINRVLDRISRGMRYGDAKIVTVAEEHGVDMIVTWNKRHYTRRTGIPVLTPSEYINTY